VDRITRKELKSDKFALEVGHTVEYVAEHRKSIIRYSVIGGAALVLVLSFLAWRRHTTAAREQAFNSAIEIVNAPIGPPSGNLMRTFPTEEARNKAAVAAFSDLAARYAGTTEGTAAEYYLGAIAADQGKMAEAQKYLKEAADSGEANYASLAKLSLAEVYQSEGKSQEGEQVLRDLIAHPTDFVSKDQATLALAGLISQNRPNEAIKMLDPLKSVSGTIGQTAVSMIAQISTAMQK
jgi:predicted negative regulator of RcsB-dependent stress response